MARDTWPAEQRRCRLLLSAHPGCDVYERTGRSDSVHSARGNRDISYFMGGGGWDAAARNLPRGAAELRYELERIDKVAVATQQPSTTSLSSHRRFAAS